MDYQGTVKKHCITSDKTRYSVVEIENVININHRVFIPGTDFKVGQRVVVKVEAMMTPGGKPVFDHVGGGEKKNAKKREKPEKQSGVSVTTA